MPEYLEIHFMVEMVRHKIQLKIVIFRVRRLGTKYLNSNSEKENRLKNFLDALPSCKTFTLVDIFQRGKEVAIIGKSFSIFIPSFGKGAYLYIIEDPSLLEKEPFKSDGWLAFEGISLETGKYCALLIVDCRLYRHEVEIRLKPTRNFWSFETKGPCILNESRKCILNFKRRLQTNPNYFRGHTIAYVLLDQMLFNGIGAYSASEILFRLYLKHKVAPFDNFWSTIMKNHDFLDDFLRSPLLFFEESKKFQFKFDPANYGVKQRSLAKMYRLHFLKVFGKKSWKGEPVVALAFKTGKSMQTVYTLTSVLKKASGPASVSKSKKKRTKESQLVLPGGEDCEKWNLVRGKRFCKKDLFVGPFEWHQKKELKDLKEHGYLSPTKLQKGGFHADKGPRYRYRKEKRSGRKCERRRQEQLWNPMVD